VHQRFGSLGDFTTLLHEAGERGIRLMLDLVVNHTLGDHAPGPAFLELSTHPGREHSAVDLQDLVLEPDEGLILRLSEGREDRS
jgi:hypothetical protein